MMPKIRYIEVRGFRVFGDTAQRLELSGGLTLVSAANSQGKTSFAEAVEFLLTGQTARAAISTNARAEFADCLRHAHLPTDSPVYVRAGIEDHTGAVHEVERVLLADYAPREDCRSRLTIDGQDAEDISALGIRLSDPPLRAPVLMQHTLRFAFSIRPQDRTDYFKSVVGVQDLELFRNALHAQANTIQADPMPEVLALRECGRLLGQQARCRAIESMPSSGTEHVENALRGLVGVVLANAGLEPDDIPPALPDRVTILRGQLAERQEAAFPFAAMLTQGIPHNQLPRPPWPAVEAYAVAVENAEHETVRLVNMLSAALAVPGLADAASALDCPLCGTEAALITERVREIRRQVDEYNDLQTRQQAAREQLRSLLDAVAELERSAGPELPRAADWSGEQEEQHRDDARTLLGPTGAALFGRAIDSLRQLKQFVEGLLADLATIRTILTEGMQATDELRTLDPEPINYAVVHVLDESVPSLMRARNTYLETSGQLVDRLRHEVDRRPDVAGWPELISLTDSAGALATGLQRLAALNRVREEIEQAVRDVDESKALVFDGKFEALSDEISRWWALMRREQAVNFSHIARRGTGRRFTDFRVQIGAANTADAVERHAAGVLSDSQLNCLGLSAFLAKCTREGSPVILLDDPVLASDEEHLTSFGWHVLRALVDQDTQVILATHDVRLSDLVRDLYAELPIDHYRITCEDPVVGACTERVQSALSAMLAYANCHIRRQDDVIRKTGATRLRDAAERLCKEIIVLNRRCAGETISIIDLDGYMLGQLIRETIPYLTRDAGDPGRLRAIGRTLNPGSHDAPVPAVDALTTACGDLTALRDRYLS